jgi:hypothetical protein
MRQSGTVRVAYSLLSMHISAPFEKNAPSQKSWTYRCTHAGQLPAFRVARKNGLLTPTWPTAASKITQTYRLQQCIINENTASPLHTRILVFKPKTREKVTCPSRIPSRASQNANPKKHIAAQSSIEKGVFKKGEPLPQAVYMYQFCISQCS